MTETAPRREPGHQRGTLLLPERETHREPGTPADPTTRIYRTHLPEGARLGRGPLVRVDRGPHLADEAAGIYPLVLAGSETPAYVVLRTDAPENEWFCTSNSCGPDGFRQYLPLRERCIGGGATYRSIPDALAAARHQPELDARKRRAQELREIADAAGPSNQVAGKYGPERVLTRAAYEAACAAIGLEPTPDDQIRSGGYGGWDLATCTPDAGIHSDLTQLRRAGLDAERERADRAALQAAIDVVGPAGPLSREQYEAGCRTAGLTPLSDAAAEEIGYDPHIEFASIGIADLGRTLAADRALGIRPRTARHLARRRTGGVHAELRQQRQAERDGLPSDFEFATVDQVREIHRLLALGVGGGYCPGPTDTEGIQNLSQDTASEYINSLRGDY
ncbi:hypothetical protein ACIQF6_28410 [Kitasatospora sp. NPDC092948]|uniref:hypothetical protein n=1 Tax=Kitasatospora sp. NPDC092948 TaxID=3364088 RepID=UPI00381E6F79